MAQPFPWLGWVAGTLISLGVIGRYVVLPVVRALLSIIHASRDLHDHRADLRELLTAVLSSTRAALEVEGRVRKLERHNAEVDAILAAHTATHDRLVAVLKQAGIVWRETPSEPR